MYNSLAIPRPARHVTAIFVAIAAIAACAIFYLFDPSDQSAGRYFPACMFHSLTGLSCPGCGSQRAIHHLLHGRLVQALAMNALLVVSIPILLSFAIRPKWAHKPWVAWTFFAVVVTFWITRNIPLWPFNLLAPHHLN